MPDGELRLIPGAGDIKGQGLGDGVEAYGDLHVELRARPHPRFQRDGRHLYTVLDISVSQALLGVNETIEHLDNRPVFIVTKAGQVVKHGAVMKIEGQGTYALVSLARNI